MAELFVCSPMRFKSGTKGHVSPLREARAGESLHWLYEPRARPVAASREVDPHI